MEADGVHFDDSDVSNTHCQVKWRPFLFGLDVDPCTVTQKNLRVSVSIKEEEDAVFAFAVWVYP